MFLFNVYIRIFLGRKIYSFITKNYQNHLYNPYHSDKIGKMSKKGRDLYGYIKSR